MKKQRLDQLLFERGMADSRERAKATVMSGMVYVNGQKVEKPGTPVDMEAQIEVRGNPVPYVSRGGLKLEKALKVFPIDPTDKVCIDCGASTGGFTDVLLQNGAGKVYAVDVGYGQLAWKLRTDARVINLERTNARYLTQEQIPEPLELAVMDVSFISVALIIPAIETLLTDGGDYVCLIKPQFEAGRMEVGKKGVVRDPKVHETVLEQFMEFISSRDLTVMGLDYSPVRGPEGNIEYLAWMKKGRYDPPAMCIPDVVRLSHEAFERKQS